MKIRIISTFVLALVYTYGLACTNLIVGKKASTDGSVIVSYSADDYGSFGYLYHYPAKKHEKGAMRSIYDWETNVYVGEIEEAAQTYQVVGNMNEHQLTITETTFGGRDELVDSTGLLDYGSLIYLTLQRSQTAHEAIYTLTKLIDKYGYNSSGESFTLADKNEAWIMELIGKGPGVKGAVWVAMRIPDDCISAHANQSRIRNFPLNDKKNCIYSPDVISFARKKGYFKGKDNEFSFCDAYAPADFGSRRYCEARVWSFYNQFIDGMEAYLPYALGRDLTARPIPLYMKAQQKISVQDIKNAMRDHYENTPFEMNDDLGGGPYNAPYRPTPLTYKVDQKTYFNERPISTQQSAFNLVAQMRSWLPNYIGGVLWFGCDDANMIAYTPVYCCTNIIPECYSNSVAGPVNFSFKSAFWVCNWISNMVYPRYEQLFGDLKLVRDELEHEYNQLQSITEKEAMRIAGKDHQNTAQAKAYLTNYSNRTAQAMLSRWMELGKYLIVKYNDMTIKKENDGKFETNSGGFCVPVIRPGYPASYSKHITEQSGERYLVPEKE